MVDVKKIIQDMARRGMNAEQIIGTLKELGVPNAEQVFQEALESLREISVAPPEGQPAETPKAAPAAAGAGAATAPAEKEEKVEITIPEEAKKPVPDLEKMISEAEAAPSAAPLEVKELRQKLDEMESLLKALQDTVKQVLETDRGVLLRLKK